MFSFLKNIKISTKIIVLVLTSSLLMGFVVMYSINQINSIGKEITAIWKIEVPLANLMNKITFHSYEQSLHFHFATMSAKRMAHGKASKDNFETERKDFRNHGRIIAQAIEKGKEIVFARGKIWIEILPVGNEVEY